MEFSPDLDRARTLVAAANRIVAMTGAGMSTDSGIPDFRGPNGVWTKDPSAEKLFTLQSYVASSEIRERSWQTRLEHPAWRAEPNDAHLALAELERDGRLSAIITQNIDGLHQAAGSSADAVVELHGTLSQTRCLDCDERLPMRDALDRVAAGESDPPCVACGGMLKSATISFGQPLEADVLDRARAEAAQCDLLLALGTSLTVQPAAGLVHVAANAGAPVVIANAAETPYDYMAEAVLREPLGELVPALVSR